MPSKYEGIIYYKRFWKKHPVINIKSTTLELMFDMDLIDKLKKDLPGIKGNLYIDIAYVGTYVLKSQKFLTNYNGITS